MLEILVNREHQLQFPEDLTLQFVEENPMFTEDRIPILHTLSFEVPPTAKNLKAFGFPNRVTSKSVVRKYQAEVRHSGIVFAKGELLLIEFQTLIKLQFKGSRENVNLRTSMNNIDFGSESFGTFPYNPQVLNYNAAELDPYTTAMKDIAISGDPFVIAPVRLEGVQWDGLEGRKGMLNAMGLYLNYYNPSTGNFYFEVNTVGASKAKCRLPIFPFPYVKDLITKVFDKYLVNNPFDDNADLAKLVMITSNHKNSSSGTLVSSYTLSGGAGRKYPVIYPLVDSYDQINGYVSIDWEYSSFMQNYLFSDFLKDLMKIFSMTTFPGMRYRMEFNNDIMNRQIKVDWNDKLAGDPVISLEPAKIYVFKYSRSEGDTNEVIINKLPSVKAIFDDVYFDPEAESSKIYEDESSSAQFSLSRNLVGLNSNVIIQSELKRNPLVTSEINNDETEKYEVSSTMTPATMNITEFWSDDDCHPDVIPKKYWYVPHITNNGIKTAPYIMFFGGMANSFDYEGEYPLLMAHHTDHFGMKRLNTSLHPEGPDGLIEKFHGSMKQWIEKDKVRIKGSFRLSVYEIRTLDISTKVALRGRLFYIEKLDYSLTNTNISLVDVDLIEC